MSGCYKVPPLNYSVQITSLITHAIISSLTQPNIQTSRTLELHYRAAYQFYQFIQFATNNWQLLFASNLPLSRPCRQVMGIRRPPLHRRGRECVISVRPAEFVCPAVLQLRVLSGPPALVHVVTQYKHKTYDIKYAVKHANMSQQQLYINYNDTVTLWDWWHSRWQSNTPLYIQNEDTSIK